MSGQIFISYRRDDSSAWAGRIYDGLSRHFVSNQIFIDVDNLDPGVDFFEAIEASVVSCDVLIAVIGKRWLISSDEEGKRRLDKPGDFVGLEIGTALKRNIRVIPVLVDNASMPRLSDLPDDLKLLVRRNALDISHNRFNADLGRLVAAIERVFENANAERKQRQENERREKDAEQAEKQRLVAQQREKERVEAEQREKELLDTKGREKERLEAEAGHREEEERLETEALQGKSKGREQQEEETVLPIFRPSPSRQPSFPQAEGPTIPPSRSQAQTKRLLAVALALALITGIAAIWFAAHREPTVALVRTTPTPPIPTPAPMAGPKVTNETPSGPPLVEPVRPNPPLSNSNETPDSRLRALATEFILAGNSPSSIDREMELYAERVDYYDEGSKSFDYIRADLLKYRKRWPSRRYEVARIVRSEYDSQRDVGSITADYTFEVSNGATRKTGQAETVLVFENVSREPRVTSVKEHTGE